eukprot:c5676_g1_i1 orf=8-229(-)
MTISFSQASAFLEARPQNHRSVLAFPEMAITWPLVAHVKHCSPSPTTSLDANRKHLTSHLIQDHIIVVHERDL